MYWSKKLLLRLLARKIPDTDFDFAAMRSLLIRPVGDAVGDAVAHAAYARQIKHVYPDCRIGILTTPRNRDVLALSPHLDELVDDTHINMWRQRKRWQVLLDFYEQFNSTHIIRQAVLAPQISVIFHKRNKKYYSVQNVLNYDFHCPPPPECHMADRLQYSVLAQRHPLPPARFALPQPDTAAAQNLWSANSVRIFLAPQGSYVKRRIPPAELAGLLRRISETHRPHAEFLLCRAQNAPAYFDELQNLCAGTSLRLKLAPPSTVREYLCLVAAADIAVCVDSGSVHLASAFQRPLLAFYANLPENLALWQPRVHEGVPHHTVIADTEISQHTHNFPLEQAAEWLNGQIHHTAQSKGLI